jgi:hypothetical protein
VPSRFPAKRTTVDGITFDSKREAKRYGELRLLERAGEIRALQIQPAFLVWIKDELFCTYTADFQYIDLRRSPDGHRMVIEDCKSSGTAKDTAYRLRKKAAELFYGIKVTETGA